ncbi:hypothetical protein PoB_005427700 [Plakobranchus ocellatus]|uniref:Uncharacterized protein n=1 Tax=Plakobranchus ocellatus TaxID=259542 RepID=A0AAV4C8S0_9GAST|nr:hypothetical protein PoB_005427700 [Plakobranchus ocellatus]
MDPYMADTEVEEENLDKQDLDLDLQPEGDDNDWVKNTRNFPRISPFSGQPGLKVDLPDDPSAFDIYKLIITDDLLRSWKLETNQYARTIINSKNHQLLSNSSRLKTWEDCNLG